MTENEKAKRYDIIVKSLENRIEEIKEVSESDYSWDVDTLIKDPLDEALSGAGWHLFDLIIDELTDGEIPCMVNNPFKGGLK